MMTWQACRQGGQKNPGLVYQSALHEYITLLRVRANLQSTPAHSHHLDVHKF
jgi:hypothetical protein